MVETFATKNDILHNNQQYNKKGVREIETSSGEQMQPSVLNSVILVEIGV